MNKFLKLLIFVFALALSGCAEKTNAAGEDALEVKAATAQFREIPDETHGFGSLSYLTKIDVTAPQEGVVQKLYFREGDMIVSGRSAALLKNPQIRIAVERAENNYSQARAALDLSRSKLQEGIFGAEAQLLSVEKAEAELAQAKKNWEEDQRKHNNQEILFEAGGLHEEAIRVSRFALEAAWEKILIMEKDIEIRRIGCREQDLRAAGFAIPEEPEKLKDALIALLTAGLRAELAAAEARLDAAEKELVSLRISEEELRVTSPASGVVGARYFEEGERVKAGEKLFTLLDTASLYALFPVREKDALRIEKGMDAVALIDGTGASRKGRVDLVYPQADSQSLSFLVRVLLDDAEGDLKPGMFVRVKVTLGPPEKVITVPESAVINRNNGEGIVFVINGTMLVERRVIHGRSLGEELIIDEGLDAGEIVALRPDADTREGMYVSVAD